MAGPWTEFQGGDLDRFYDDAGKQNGVDPDLLRSVHSVESRGNDMAVSPAGALGRGQFLPSTARSVGMTDPFNARQSIYGTAKYLKVLSGELGDDRLAVAGYHGGPNTQEWGPKTAQYVQHVSQDYQQRKAAEAPPPSGPWTQFQKQPQQTGPWALFQQQDEGRPLTNAEAVKQLPMAERDEGTAQPQIQVGNGADLAKVLSSPEAEAADIPQSQAPADTSEIQEAMRKAYASTPPLVNPQSGTGQWLSQHGMSGLTQPIVPMAAMNAGWAGLSEAAIEATKRYAGEGAAKTVGQVMEMAGSGALAPELMGGGMRMHEAPAAPVSPPGVRPEPQATAQTLPQRSATPTLDAVASEARARAQTPEQAALDELHQQAAPAPEAPAGSAIEALKKQAATDTPAAPMQQPPPSPAGTPATEPPLPAARMETPPPTPPDVRQRLAEVSAKEAELSKAEEAANAPAPEVDKATNRPAGSWVAVSKETGQPVLETFEKQTADAIDKSKYDVLPAGEYLGNLNKQIREGQAPEETPPTPPAPPPRRGEPTPFEKLPREPMRLVEWLKQNGGIKDEGGDLNAILGGSKGRPGLINNKRGATLDDAAHAAWQAGYLPDASRPDTNALLDAIRDDHTGTKRYSQQDFDRVQDYQEAVGRNEEVDRLATTHEIETRGKTRDQFYDELHDRLSTEDRAREIAEQEAGFLDAQRELDRGAREHKPEPEAGLAPSPWNAREFYGQSQARTLEDLEREHREETHPAAAQQRGEGAERPAPAAPPEGVGQEAEGPRGRAAGDAGRGEAVSAEAGIARPWEQGGKQRVYFNLGRGKSGFIEQTAHNGDYDWTMRYPTANRGGEKVRDAMHQWMAERFGNERNPQWSEIWDRANGKTPAADLLGRQIAEPRAKAGAEPTIRNDPNQIGMPGMEASAVQAQAARDAQGRGALQSEAPQKPANEGLFAPDTTGQGTLYSFPGALVDPEAWRRAFGPLAPALTRLRDSSRALAKTIADGVAPMQSGTKRSQAFAADFANGLRQINYRFGEIDKEIEGAFPRQERDAMGRALDAQSVFEQQLRQMPPEMRDAARAEFDSGGTGLAGLNERQRQVIDSLDAISQDVWRRMQERGMVAPQAQGLPYYMPRQILMWSEENGFQRPGSGGPTASIGIDGRGANLTTAGPMSREHLTPEETEAAARAKLGEGAQLLRDIRSLPARLAFSERAIVGTDLMNRIDEVGKQTGVNLMVRGDIPGLLNPGDYFTMADHPSFRRWTGTGWQALHVAKEFEGPLKAVLSKKSPEWYRAAQNLKSGIMSAIMYSPLIHLAVELGRSLPVMPMRVLTLQVIRDGGRLRGDRSYMEQAVRDGLSPLGRRGWVDVASIADQAREPPVESALRRTIMAIPHAWDQMHQRLLWDQVFNLQVGLYDGMRSKFIAKGFEPDVAGTMAAHLANRYAGALPPEHLSREANMMANLLLFSRSFTLGNLGVMKDMFNGAPSQIRARIEQMAGPEAAKSAQSALRRKALTAFAMDVGLFYSANALLQAGLQVMRQSQTSGLPQAAQDVFNQWYDEATSAVAHAGSNPLSIFGVLPQHWNEPGKQDRVYAGTDSTGRGVYLRLPPGKVGEEFMGWFAKPGTMLMNKASPLVRPIIELIMGHDSLGRELLPPNPRTIGDYVDTAGAIVKHIGENLGPTSTLQGLHEMYQQHIQGKPTQADPGISAAKVLAPLTGLAQVSQGYPGGPAAGEIHAQDERQKYAIQHALPGVREKIRAGDTEGAVADMTKLGVPPGLQRYYLRQTINPQPSRRALQNFQRTAPPEVMERYQRQVSP